jgi:hypothetical protein
MPISPGPNNQGYLDPSANNQRNNITSALMNVAAPPPQMGAPGMAPALSAGGVPPQMPMPQMPPPGTGMPQLSQPMPGMPNTGMPTPGMPPPNVPLSPGVPPIPPQPGMPPPRY